MNKPTAEQILKMEPGPELDALFAEVVMRRQLLEHKQYPARNSWWEGKLFICYQDDFQPSSNISHVMEGVQKK